MWVVCIFSAWFQSLTFPVWNPIQGVSCVHLLCLISITDIPCMIFYPGSESCAPLLDFNHWHSLHEILSRMWVVCPPSAQFWSLIYYHMHCLVCSYSNVLSSPHSINMPAFHRQMPFTILLMLNSKYYFLAFLISYYSFISTPIDSIFICFYMFSHYYSSWFYFCFSSDMSSHPHLSWTFLLAYSARL